MSDWLESRARVADLVHAYALHIRQGEPARCAELFTPDGSFEVRTWDPRNAATLTTRTRTEGRAAIAGFIGSSTGAVRMFPMIHNLLVTVNGDRAEASSLMIGRPFPEGSEVIGEYADSFRRVDGRWFFTARIYTIARAA
ncbi:MAG: nuclear transport factor 2 family protein [Sphingomonadales bacterium]|nr:nuclear transport factor 2 family protein [Sphingomonadales bacterium]